MEIKDVENSTLIFRVNYLEDRVQLQQVAKYGDGCSWWEDPSLRGSKRFDASILPNLNYTRGAPIMDINDSIGAAWMGHVFITDAGQEYLATLGRVVNDNSYMCSTFGIFKPNLTDSDDFDFWDRVLPLEVIHN